MNEHFGIEIRSKLEKLPQLSSFIGNSMLKLGLNEYDQFQVQIAVEEATKNIINSAYLKKDDKISFKCEMDDGEIKIIIKYPGRVFNPAEPERYTETPPKAPALTTYFIKKYMNVKHRFEDGTNVLTLIKR